MSDPRIAAARQGDRDALATLLAAHGPGVRARVAPLVPASSRGLLDVDDVMQVTYLEVFLRIGDLAGDSAAAFAGWLRAIAEHNLADGLRALARHKRAPAAPASRAADELIDGLLAATTSPSRAAARDELRAWVVAALAAMPSDYARAIELYDLQGRSIDDVARVLGRSRGAVHMLRARAHDCLRARLGGSDRFWSRTS